ncbi:hypothetical protein RFI_18508 [Reticulomyxa filosa]|uniref:Uncharacterized protein n=1 Tax=Reticulomyxa filosa TaxID=46433 RepID=X6MZ26_RETFI|nr:hypothetical protein RFI_18508 [Reticulomyxa filosa]|eukprot:ETO18749.1 hypothetical protein RFI_18508 [Reticulomyxa filosa]
MLHHDNPSHNLQSKLHSQKYQLLHLIFAAVFACIFLYMLVLLTRLYYYVLRTHKKNLCKKCVCQKSSNWRRGLLNVYLIPLQALFQMALTVEFYWIGNFLENKDEWDLQSGVIVMTVLLLLSTLLYFVMLCMIVHTWITITSPFRKLEKKQKRNSKQDGLSDWLGETIMVRLFIIVAVMIVSLLMNFMLMVLHLEYAYVYGEYVWTVYVTLCVCIFCYYGYKMDHTSGAWTQEQLGDSIKHNSVGAQKDTLSKPQLTFENVPSNSVQKPNLKLGIRRLGSDNGQDNEPLEIAGHLAKKSWIEQRHNQPFLVAASSSGSSSGSSLNSLLFFHLSSTKETQVVLLQTRMSVGFVVLFFFVQSFIRIWSLSHLSSSMMYILTSSSFIIRLLDLTSHTILLLVLVYVNTSFVQKTLLRLRPVSDDTSYLFFFFFGS